MEDVRLLSRSGLKNRRGLWPGKNAPLFNLNQPLCHYTKIEIALISIFGAKGCVCTYVVHEEINLFVCALQGGSYSRTHSFESVPPGALAVCCSTYVATAFFTAESFFFFWKIGLYLHPPRGARYKRLFLRARIGVHSLSMSREGAFVYDTEYHRNSVSFGHSRAAAVHH